MAQNPPNDRAANHERHMQNVRASQRRGQLIRLQRAFVHYRALPDRSPPEQEDFDEIKRQMAALEDQMRAAGQEP